MWIDPRTVDEDLPSLYTKYQTHQPDERVVPLRFARIRGFAKRAMLFESLEYHDLSPARGLAAVGKLLAWSSILRSRLGRSVLWLRGPWRGDLLDVGAGNGAFLVRMRQLGWRGTGVDFDAAAVRVCRDVHGLEAHCGTLDSVTLPDASFDVITMSHVIEHLPDPKRTLHRCMQLLKPGGRLVVVTPNARSLGHSSLGPHWFALDPPRHLFIFSPEALASCVRDAGLQVTQIWTEAQSSRDVVAKSLMIRRVGAISDYKQSLRMPLAFRLYGVVFWAVEHLLSKWRPVGEEIVMIATRA